MFKKDGLVIKHGNLGSHFKENKEATKDSVLDLLSQKTYTMDSLLAETNGEQLYALVAVFRETKYWKHFLIALLRLSPEVWEERSIFPEYLEEKFTLREKKEILTIDAEMVVEGRQSPLLPFLKFEMPR
jgi:hypothetical protein